MDFIEESLTLINCQNYLSSFTDNEINEKEKFLNLGKNELRIILPGKIGIQLKVWRLILFHKGFAITPKIEICPEKISLIISQRENKNQQELIQNFTKNSSPPIDREDDDLIFPIDICPICRKENKGQPAIGCDDCDNWYHFTCLALKKVPPKKKKWYCSKCSQKNMTKRPASS